jgi:DNA-binding GntR family transcriptional regulator
MFPPFQGLESGPTMSTAGKRMRRHTRGSSAEDVAKWVRERVRRGRLVPGQRLVEADLIAQTGASRSKVREALQRLEAEDLVVIEEFRGASVKRVGPDEVRQIYTARMALEGVAAAEFAAADAPALKERLQKLQSEMDRRTDEDGHESFARLNGQWHELIVRGSGNTYVAQFLARLTVPIYRLMFSTFYSEQSIRRANADHQKITAAIVAGRAREAETAMRRHISDGLAALTEIRDFLGDEAE